MTDSIHTPGDEVTEPRRESALQTAVALLEGALYLRMYGERPPGGERETWPRWDTSAETFLRSFHDDKGRPLRCPLCGEPLYRATDVYIVVCSGCLGDFVVKAHNDYLLAAPQYQIGETDALPAVVERGE